MLNQLLKLIRDNFSEELAQSLLVGLAVVCSISLKRRQNPVALIIEGGSGRGKSLTINLLTPDRESTKQYVFRSDKFTPASFVSHSAKANARQLEKIDLLPKLKDKTLVVKELGPLFRGREDNLRENFSILTAVLDGKGLVASSGVHGTRGYDGDYVFNWLGATTPVPASTDAIMAQLGNRLLRYEIKGNDPTFDELVQYAGGGNRSDIEAACRKLANDFIEDHFKRFPASSVDPETLAMPQWATEGLVRWGIFISCGRVEVESSTAGSGEPEYVAGLPEGPHRVIAILKTLLQSLTLVAGRDEVLPEDMRVLRHVAFSSIPSSRRKVLRAVIAAQGTLPSTLAENLLGVSRPTARRWMREMVATGIAQFDGGSDSEALRITLASDWLWLLDAESEVQVCKPGLAESN